MPQKVRPLCPVFGDCRGCAYQDLPYEEELALKKSGLEALLDERFGAGRYGVAEIVPSPGEYHTRSRLDITLKRVKGGEPVMGFVSGEGHRVVPIESCAIARTEISDFLPELRRLASEKLPPDYRTANLVVKSGDDRRVFWGGIGRRSLKMLPRDYLWTDIAGKKIFYSLETFFQANLAILPALMKTLECFAAPDPRDTLFLDLYAGVGLFGVYFADRVSRVVMVEDNPASVELAGYNAAFHRIGNAEIRRGKVEDELPLVLENLPEKRKIAVIDPPRQGLSPAVLERLADCRTLDALFYLSCSPASLVRDLAGLIEKGWRIVRITAFDFFPKTEHLETLVWLAPAPQTGRAG